MSGDGGLGAGSIGGFIRRAISEGMSVTKARNAFRSEQIGRMSNAAFGQMYGQVRAAIGNRSAIAALDYNAIPPAEALTEWRAGAGGRYSSFVEVLVREIGSRDVSTRFHQFVTDEPHTPQDAVDAAIDVISMGSEDGTTPSGEVVLDGVVTSMTRTIAR